MPISGMRRTEQGKGAGPPAGVVGLIFGRARAGSSLRLHYLENAVEILQGRVLDQDLAFAVAVGNGDPDARCPLQLLLGRVPQPFPRKFYCLGPFFDLFNWGAPPLSPGFGDRVGTIFTESPLHRTHMHAQWPAVRKNCQSHPPEDSGSR